MKGATLTPADGGYNLGELQPYYASALTALNALDRFHGNQSFAIQITHLKKQVTTNEKLHRTLRYQQVLTRQELALAKEKYSGNSVYSEHLISPQSEQSKLTG